MSESLFHSPVGLYPFQQESIAQDYVKVLDGGGMLIVWDAGAGKTVFGIRMSCLLQEEGRGDLTLVMCERGKIDEWIEDFTTFSDQVVHKHYGPNRMRRLEKAGQVDVIVTTYETAKLDLVKFNRQGKTKRGTKLSAGPLFERLAGQSVLWLADESAAKLGNRGTDLYKAIEWSLKEARKLNPKQRVFGLTATPMESGYENAYNQGRLMFPQAMPKVGEFEQWFVKSRHPVYHTPRYDMQNIRMFRDMVAPHIDRRRKTDPDIMEQFPKKVEQFIRVDMHPKQAALYERIAKLQSLQEEPIPGLWLALRLVADHPASLVEAARTGESVLIKMLVEEIGEEEILATPSAKEKELLVRLDHIVNGQGDKAVCFTFFGQTVLRVLAQSLRSKGFDVYENHGGMTQSESADIRAKFRQSERPGVYLTSDAGARGINLPEATNIFEFESSLTYANHVQRIDRIHRINSTSPTVVCSTMVTNKSVEEGIVRKMLARNEQMDILLGDEDAGESFMTAQERKSLF